MIKSIEKNANISEKFTGQNEEDSFIRIYNKLDPESKTIVSYVQQNRFATLDELSSLCRFPHHMHILLKIKDVINPLAENIKGSPLLIFEKFKIDHESGRRIFFSWWLAGEESGISEEKMFLDIFDEGDSIRIILESLKEGLENIEIKVKGDKLLLNADFLEGKYQEEIFLPSSVSSKGMSRKYNNGVLEVKFQKL